MYQVTNVGVKSKIFYHIRYILRIIEFMYEHHNEIQNRLNKR